ncbi:MAG TPA: hypothetical protein PKM50_04295 [Methanoregula sp.]|nr:hypothetical protein [Methanoregula sp.]
MVLKKVTVFLCILLTGLFVCPSLADPLMSQVKTDDSLNAMGYIPLGIGYVNNDYLALSVQDEANPRFPSRFSLKTTGGDPANVADNNIALLHSYEYPWSSYATIRINGTDHIYGDASCTYTGIPEVHSDYEQSSCLIGSVDVTQKLTLVKNPETGRADILEIKYLLKNTGTTSKSVGLRLELDTRLGKYDGSVFRIPGALIKTETEFYNSDVPDYWTAYDPQPNPVLSSNGTLRGGDATPPDRIVFGYWGTLGSTAWDYTINKYKAVTGDSAIGLYWYPEALVPGDEAEYVTYYGLGRYVPAKDPNMALSIAAPLNLEVITNQYSPNPFMITAIVKNTEDVILDNVSTTLTLPSGLTLAGGTATQVIGTINPDGSGSASWQVIANEQGTDVTLTYTVSAIATDVPEKIVTGSITFPALQTTCVDDLQATASCNDVDLSWTDTGADHYNVYRGTVAGGPYVFVASVTGTDYEDSDVTSGTTYYYVIREVDAAGSEICQSNEATATIPVACSPVPEFPTPALPLLTIAGILLSIATVRRMK